VGGGGVGGTSDDLGAWRGGKQDFGRWELINSQSAYEGAPPAPRLRPACAPPTCVALRSARGRRGTGAAISAGTHRRCGARNLRGAEFAGRGCCGRAGTGWWAQGTGWCRGKAGHISASLKLLFWVNVHFAITCAIGFHFLRWLCYPISQATKMKLERMSLFRC
jgi:hypothetical protein